MDFARFGWFWGAPDGNVFFSVFASLCCSFRATGIHAGTDPAATDIANLTEAKQIADGAASKLEKILLLFQVIMVGTIGI